MGVSNSDHIIPIPEIKGIIQQLSQLQITNIDLHQNNHPETNHFLSSHFSTLMQSIHELQF